MTKEEYWFWLVNIKGIGRRSIEALLKKYKTPENIFNAQAHEIKEAKILKENQLKELEITKENMYFLKQYDNMKKRNIKFIVREDEEYPELLTNIYDAPYALYVKGELPLKKSKNVAIVGARSCSEYGRAMAVSYAQTFAKNGIGIISGLAEGIDSYGHMGALNENGKTYAVLGCGINVCYPRENIKLYEKICENGGIISEYGLNESPRAWFFPDRNRIISALSQIVLVVEAKKKSGSLITADFALEQGKDVFAVPGRVGDMLSEGCNYLISNGAGCAFSADEILNQLDINIEDNNKIIKKSVNSLETKENMVYSCLDLKPKNLEEIVALLDMDISEILYILLNLEIKGYIKETVKNYYVRCQI